MSVVRQGGRFIVYLANRFYRDQCLRTAAALSYTSLLSLVPFLAVMFSILAAFPVFETLVDKFQDFIFSNFVPASGEVIQQHIQGFVKHASSLSGIGIGFLIVTALLLMDSIDSALNGIWRVRAERSQLSKFMLYWAVLTLGPILVGVGMLASSYIISLPLFSDTGETIRGFKTNLVSLMPFITTLLALTMLYVLVPYTRIRFHHGVIGAVVAAILFEVAKKGFALYVTNFPTYAVVYGVLAAIPVFLVWIYVSWIVVLLGAEITYCITTFEVQEVVEKPPSEDSGFIDCYRIIGHLWQGQSRGELLTEEKLQALEPQMDRGAMLGGLEQLENARLIHRTMHEEWSLSRDMEDLSLWEIYRIYSGPLPDLQGGWATLDQWNKALSRVLAEAGKGLELSLRIPLKQLYQGGGQH